ncbi:MAG: diacylglycerol/lipid kinase family protein [Spirochaetota bacterium]
MRSSESILIINPTRYPHLVPRLTKLAARMVPAPVRITESRSDFLGAVEEFAGGRRRYALIWGGDGTVHDAVNVLMRCRERGIDLDGKGVGFLRGGSGNGTQDSYDVPRRLRNQLRAYRAAMDGDMSVDVDLLRIRVGDHVRYGQLLGMGFDTRVLRRRLGRQEGVIPPGVFRYIYAAAGVFLSREWAHRHMALELSEGKYAFRGNRINAEFAFERIRRDVSVSLLEVGTRPYYGALFKVCPDVVCNDGLMDVYAYCFTRRFQVVRNVGALWAGRHGVINDRLMGKRRRGVIERYEVRAAEIYAPDEEYYHVDGELLPLPPNPAERVVSLSLLPRALRFLVPASYYRLVHPFTEE